MDLLTERQDLIVLESVLAAVDLKGDELEDVIAASTGQQSSVLDNAGKTFEQAADGILDFLNGLGG